jgi:hypothetical protein
LEVVVSNNRAALTAGYSVLIGCYGDYPQYSLRAVKSAATPDRKHSIHVGCNICCAETVATLQDMFKNGEIDSLFLSNHNINKDPMMRLLIDRADTDYVIWLDDDSHFTNTAWPTFFDEFVANESFDVAGHVFYSHPHAEYVKFREARPWWRGNEYFIEEEHVRTTWFPTGGLFMARTAYLREHDFPDRLMIKKMDDILLGDMASQTHGKLINFSGAIMSAISISDGNRRGEGEQDSDWRYK